MKLKSGRAYFQTLHLHKEPGMDFLLSFWWLSAMYVHGTYKRRQKRKERIKRKRITTVPSEIRNAQLTGCTRPSGFWKVQRKIRAGEGAKNTLRQGPLLDPFGN
jgi:hypothetical protein